MFSRRHPGEGETTLVVGASEVGVVSDEEMATHPELA
jgi:hypothetical protein